MPECQDCGFEASYHVPVTREQLADVGLVDWTPTPLTRWERIRYGVIPDTADRFRAAWSAFKDPWGNGR